MAHGTAAPVIIKRKKVVGGDGHHGGAWKVAYADFVTAMMAFFMLMWLLNATTEKQRKGIADYFNPTIPVNRVSGGGEGAFGGESVFSERMLAQTGTGATFPSPSPDRQARGTVGTGRAVAEKDTKTDGQIQAQIEAQAQALREVENMLNGLSGESLLSEQLLRHIVTRLTDEGLIIELFDIDGAPLFSEDGAEPTEVLDELIAVVGQAFALVRNQVAVAGYVAARPVVLADNPVWDLSTRRAQIVRRLLEKDGLAAERVERVTGYADRKPVVSDRMAARNNRLELVLLRSDIVK